MREDLSEHISEGYETPPIFARDYVVDGNYARQVVVMPFSPTALTVEDDKYYIYNGDEAYELVGVGEAPQGEAYFQLQDEPINGLPNLSSIIGIASKSLDSPNAVKEGLAGRFHFKESGIPSGTKGLRTAQLGAMHAILSHWTVNDTDPGTVVMPTGTGKTETMLSVFANQGLSHLLVIVPTDNLRTQIGEKFQQLGKLRELGVVDNEAPNPVVGFIEHGFTSELNARAFAEACNVIVTTPNALLASSSEVWKIVTSQSTQLFIDEAHHSPANTWQQILDEFSLKPVIQFTATPYRGDGKLMRGKIIYNFPLRKAKDQGYFSRINYVSVFDIANTDVAIATTAIEKLRLDIAENYDHILMARARTISHAKSLLEMYTQLAPDLNPVITHSQQTADEKGQALSALFLDEHGNRESRIIVCVDMLGEGFDLPALKVAAIHKQHQSLGVTLQFIGRFARVGGVGQLSDATVVVSRTENHTDKRLQQLYAEDSDWNELITELSAEAINERVEVDEFEEGFGQLPPEISLKSLEPKMSTVVYKTDARAWHPEVLMELVKKNLYTKKIAINQNEHVLWFVTKDTSSVSWGNIKEIENTNYGLIVCYWNQDAQLLYINSSANDGVYGSIASALFDDSAELIKGTNVYRTLANINRRVPTNVGKKNILTNIFSMVMGARIEFTQAEMESSRQTNIFAHGFDAGDGSRVAIGASVKGRIWTSQSADGLLEWMKWCDYVGAKLDDSTIDYVDVLQGFIIPESIKERPDLIPLLIEWSTDVYMNTSDSIKIRINGVSTPLIDCEMRITSFSKSGPIPFDLYSETEKASYELHITNGNMEVRPVNGGNAEVITRNAQVGFAEYIQDMIGMRVLFEQQTVLEPDMTLLKFNTSAPPMNPDFITTYNWSGIDFSKESWGEDRDSDAIQARAVEYLQGLDTWEVLIDDDGSGEIADLVGLRVEGNVLKVNLTHCKFSSVATAGARIKDLYEVCGQAQKSIQRRRSPDNMLANLLRREINRRTKYQRNNFIVGDELVLKRLIDRARMLQVEFTVTIVQPGVSKRAIKPSMLSLLAATQSYIVDVGGRNAKLDILVSQ